MELLGVQRLVPNWLQFDSSLATCSCATRHKLCCLIFIHFSSAAKVIGKSGCVALRTAITFDGQIPVLDTYRSLQRLLKEQEKKQRKREELYGLWRCTVQDVIALISTHRFCIFRYQPKAGGYLEQQCCAELFLKALSTLSTRVCYGTW